MSDKIAKIQKFSEIKAKKTIQFSDDEMPDDSPTESKKKEMVYRTDELPIDRLDDREKMLLRPGMYIGSIKKSKSSGPIWVFDRSVQKFVCKEIYYTDGLLRLFIEAASNSIDNIWRSLQFKIPTKIIKFYFNKDTGEFGVWNDGKPIPTGLWTDTKTNKQTGETVPEVIFGTFNSSTNYRDNEEKRKTSGLNGVGTRAVNVYSKYLKLELFNPKDKVIYQQTWTDNMSKKQPAVLIRDSKKFPKHADGEKTGYTFVRWLPDYKYFDMTNGVDDDFMSILMKTIYDYAMVASKYKVKTFFNDEEIPVYDLLSYVSLYYKDPLLNHIICKSSDCEVLIAPRADSEFKKDSVSFVNGIHTSDGGMHVDLWEEQIYRPIIDKINGVTKTTKSKPDKKKKTKKPATRPQINISEIRKHLTLFIVTEVENPSFEGQNKTKFLGPPIEVTVKRNVLPN